jgi:hypothetical protein
VIFTVHCNPLFARSYIYRPAWALLRILEGLRNRFSNTQHMRVYTLICICHYIIELFKPVYKIYVLSTAHCNPRSPRSYIGHHGHRYAYLRADAAHECVYPHMYVILQLFKPAYQQPQEMFSDIYCPLQPMIYKVLHRPSWASISIFEGLHNRFSNTQHMSVYTLICICHYTIVLFNPV